MGGRGASSKAGTKIPVKVKVESYIPADDKRYPPKPAQVKMQEINMYKSVPSGWGLAYSSNMDGTVTGIVGYIRIDNGRKSFFDKARQTGYVTIETARKAGLISQREYEIEKDRRVKEIEHIRKYRGGQK